MCAVSMSNIYFRLNFSVFDSDLKFEHVCLWSFVFVFFSFPAPMERESLKVRKPTAGCECSVLLITNGKIFEFDTLAIAIALGAKGVEQ